MGQEKLSVGRRVNFTVHNWGRADDPQGKYSRNDIEFYKQPKEIILKVIEVLEKQNKAVRI